MRRIVSCCALILAVVLTGAPLSGAEEAPAAPVSETAASSPELPADLFSPAPDKKYGIKYGPCSVFVNCLSGVQISCSGQGICYWKLEKPTPGFVECDGVRTTCPLN